MNRTRAHQILVDKILFAVGSLPYARVWPRSVGFAKTANRSFTYGIPGESDIDGILAPSGRRLSIEVKTGSGVLSDKQIIWKAMIEKFGGLHILARSVDQVLAEIDKAR